MNTKAKDKFLEMRINGKTYESISKELKVSKQTLINWSKEIDLKEAMTVGRLMTYQSILKQHGMNKEARILAYSELIQKVTVEISQRDFKKLSDEKLLEIMIQLEKGLAKITPEPKIIGGGLDIDGIIETKPSFIINVLD